jgi:hypothetical protein
MVLGMSYILGTILKDAARPHLGRELLGFVDSRFTNRDSWPRGNGSRKIDSISHMAMVDQPRCTLARRPQALPMGK